MIARHLGEERVHSRWRPRAATSAVSEDLDREDHPSPDPEWIDPELVDVPRATSRRSLAFIGIAVLIGFWITPIWYTRQQVPSRFMLLYQMNPMTHLIEAQRSLLLHGRYPTVQSLVYVAIGAVVISVLGYLVFAHYRESVPEHL